MQPKLSRSSTPEPSPHRSNSYSFLIPRSERLRFLLLFTLMTGIGAALGRWIANIVSNLPILTPLQVPDPVFTLVPIGAIWLQFIQSTIVGTCIGVTQWLVLRNYISNWLWIVATGGSFVFVSVIPSAFLQLIMQGVIKNGFAISWTYFIVPIGIICYLVYGLAQRFVLKHHVTAAWKWVFVPLISFCITGLLRLPVLLSVQQGQQISPESNLILSSIFAAIGFGAIQSMILCRFHRKISDNSSSASEIINSRQMQELSRQLYNKLDLAWKTESTTKEDLIYVVVVAQNGTIVSYQPVNQAASDYASQTPLSELVRIPQANNETTRELVGQFQVVFTSTGQIEISFD